MQHVFSKDGTRIAYDRSGDGAPLILVVGAFNTRSTGAPLAASVGAHNSVYTYDRRGRGDSGDVQPYAVEREIEDLAALIDQAGGSAAVFGYSSGAVLAMQAASRGLAITKLALYDPPFIVDQRVPRIEHAPRLAELIAAGRRGDAVEYFQQQVVGIPAEVVAQLRHAPFRPALEAMAHTLVYEALILGDGSVPTDVASGIGIPSLVVGGGASAFMRASAQALTRLIPNAQLEILEGIGHDIEPSVLGPVLDKFLLGRRA